MHSNRARVHSIGVVLYTKKVSAYRVRAVVYVIGVLLLSKRLVVFVTGVLLTTRGCRQYNEIFGLLNPKQRQARLSPQPRVIGCGDTVSKVLAFNREGCGVT